MVPLVSCQCVVFPSEDFDCILEPQQFNHTVHNWIRNRRPRKLVFGLRVTGILNAEWAKEGCWVQLWNKFFKIWKQFTWRTAVTAQINAHSLSGANFENVFAHAGQARVFSQGWALQLVCLYNIDWWVSVPDIVTLYLAQKPTNDNGQGCCQNLRKRSRYSTVTIVTDEEFHWLEAYLFFFRRDSATVMVSQAIRTIIRLDLDSQRGRSPRENENQRCREEQHLTSLTYLMWDASRTTQLDAVLAEEEVRQGSTRAARASVIHCLWSPKPNRHRFTPIPRSLQLQAPIRPNNKERRKNGVRTLTESSLVTMVTRTERRPALALDRAPHFNFVYFVPFFFFLVLEVGRIFLFLLCYSVL